MNRRLHILLIFLTVAAFASCSNNISMGDKEAETEKTQTPLPDDVDGDGVLDEDDNCPTLANADQADGDGDGVGNVCEDLECASNFCEDNGFLSGYHCDGDASVRCIPQSDGCLVEMARVSCDEGCQSDGVNAGICKPKPPLPGDPEIDSLAGSGAHGATIQITGSNFGSHSLDTYWSGDLIEDTPVGVNPDTWEHWKHRLPNDGRTDHITDEIAWSGSKSMDLTVNQKTTGSYKSTLSYVVGNFRKMFLSYWLYVDVVTYAEGAKHLRITCDSECGSQAFGTPLNCFSHTGDILPNGLMGKWGGGTQSRIECPDNELTQFNEPFKHAFGVGYDRTPGPSQGWLRAHRGQTEPVSIFGYETDMWIRLDYYYDKGVADTYSGEMRMATTRPKNSAAGNAGHYIGKWEKNILMETDRTDCQDLTDRGSSVLPPRAEIVGFMLFTDNEADDAHIRWFIDDVYVQTGTRARIELCDMPNYADCTHLEIQEPISWSDGDIQFRLNHGGFKPGDQVYLFVINENEWDNGDLKADLTGKYDFQGISPGYPITLE